MTTALFLSGDMENAPRFPHPHTRGDDYGTNVQRGLTLTLHLVQKDRSGLCAPVPAELRLINMVRDVVILDGRPIVCVQEGLNRMGAQGHATQQVLLTSLDEGAIRGCVFRVVAPISTIGLIDGNAVYVQ